MQAKVWMIALLIVAAALLLGIYRALWDYFESPLHKGHTVAFHRVIYPVLLWVLTVSAYAASTRDESVSAWLTRVSISSLLILLWIWTPRFQFPDYYWPPAVFTLLLTFPAILVPVSWRRRPWFKSLTRSALDSYLIFAAVYLAVLKDTIPL